MIISACEWCLTDRSVHDRISFIYAKCTLIIFIIKSIFVYLYNIRYYYLIFNWHEYIIFFKFILEIIKSNKINHETTYHPLLSFQLNIHLLFCLKIIPNFNTNLYNFYLHPISILIKLDS